MPHAPHLGGVTWHLSLCGWLIAHSIRPIRAVAQASVSVPFKANGITLYRRTTSADPTMGTCWPAGHGRYCESPVGHEPPGPGALGHCVLSLSGCSERTLFPLSIFSSWNSKRPKSRERQGPALEHVFLWSLGRWRGGWGAQVGADEPALHQPAFTCQGSVSLSLAASTRVRRGGTQVPMPASRPPSPREVLGTDPGFPPARGKGSPALAEARAPPLLAARFSRGLRLGWGTAGAGEGG